MNHKTDIDQILEAAAAAPCNGAGLKSAKEVKNEFHNQLSQVREVPYLQYFLKSAAIITVIFTILFFGCMNRKERIMEKENYKNIMLACFALKTLNGDLMK